MFENVEKKIFKFFIILHLIIFININNNKNNNKIFLIYKQINHILKIILSYIFLTFRH